MVRKKKGIFSLFSKGGEKRMSAVQAKAIKATTVEGRYAQEVIEELMSKPSFSAIIRNKKASDLVKKLRK